MMHEIEATFKLITRPGISMGMKLPVFLSRGDNFHCRDIQTISNELNLPFIVPYGQHFLTLNNQTVQSKARLVAF